MTTAGLTNCCVLFYEFVRECEIEKISRNPKKFRSFKTYYGHKHLQFKTSVGQATLLKSQVQIPENDSASYNAVKLKRVLISCINSPLREVLVNPVEVKASCNTLCFKTTSYLQSFDLINFSRAFANLTVLFQSIVYFERQDQINTFRLVLNILILRGICGKWNKIQGKFGEFNRI